MVDPEKTYSFVRFVSIEKSLDEESFEMVLRRFPKLEKLKSLHFFHHFSRFLQDHPSIYHLDIVIRLKYPLECEPTKEERKSSDTIEKNEFSSFMLTQLGPAGLPGLDSSQERDIVPATEEMKVLKKSFDRKRKNRENFQKRISYFIVDLIYNGKNKLSFLKIKDVDYLSQPLLSFDSIEVPKEKENIIREISRIRTFNVEGHQVYDEKGFSWVLRNLLNLRNLSFEGVFDVSGSNLFRSIIQEKPQYLQTLSMSFREEKADFMILMEALKSCPSLLSFSYKGEGISNFEKVSSTSELYVNLPQIEHLHFGSQFSTNLRGTLFSKENLKWFLQPDVFGKCLKSYDMVSSDYFVDPFTSIKSGFLENFSAVIRLEDFENLLKSFPNLKIMYVLVALRKDAKEYRRTSEERDEIPDNIEKITIKFDNTKAEKLTQMKIELRAFLYFRNMDIITREGGFSKDMKKFFFNLPEFLVSFPKLNSFTLSTRLDGCLVKLKCEPFEGMDDTFDFPNLKKLFLGKLKNSQIIASIFNTFSHLESIRFGSQTFPKVAEVKFHPYLKTLQHFPVNRSSPRNIQFMSKFGNLEKLSFACHGRNVFDKVTYVIHTLKDLRIRRVFLALASLNDFLESFPNLEKLDVPISLRKRKGIDLTVNLVNHSVRYLCFVTHDEGFCKETVLTVLEGFKGLRKLNLNCCIDQGAEWNDEIVKTFEEDFGVSIKWSFLSEMFDID